MKKINSLVICIFLTLLPRINAQYYVNSSCSSCTDPNVEECIDSTNPDDTCDAEGCSGCSCGTGGTWDTSGVADCSRCTAQQKANGDQCPTDNNAYCCYGNCHPSCSSDCNSGQTQCGSACCSGGCNSSGTDCQSYDCNGVPDGPSTWQTVTSCNSSNNTCSIQKQVCSNGPAQNDCTSNAQCDCLPSEKDCKGVCHGTAVVGCDGKCDSGKVFHTVKGCDSTKNTCTGSTQKCGGLLELFPDDCSNNAQCDCLLA